MQRLSDLACQKITGAPFHIIVRPERIPAADETYVPAVLWELQLERRVAVRNCTHLVQNLPGKEGIVNGT
jgi:hypothetical protein